MKKGLKKKKKKRKAASAEGIERERDETGAE